MIIMNFTCKHCQDLEYEEKIIVFDLYGTLVNWEYSIGSFIEFYISPKAIHHFFKCDITKVSEYRPYREILEECLVETAGKYNIVVNRDLIESFILSFAKSPPYPDTIYGLKVLKKHGFKTCVLSNTDRNLIEITLNGFKELFDHIITAQDVKAYKPNKQAFLRAYEKLSVDPNRAIHVSAYPQYDLEPASEIGALTVLVDRGLGYTWPLKVNTLLDLVNVIG